MSVVIDGNLGITTPAETVQGALTTTGNTILGDASTDTLNVGNGGLVKDASGNVGIGTASPTYPLTLGNNKRFGALNTGGSGVNFAIVDGSNNLTFGDDSVNTNTLTIQSRGYTSFSLNGSERMRIDSSGNLSLASGTFSAIGVYNNTTASAANIHVSSAGGLFFRSTSALKYKQYIRDLESIDIGLLRPVRYKSKCDGDDKTKDHFGLIADEAAEAGFEELVTRGADGEVEGFQYERLTVVLLKAIQELKAIVDAQAVRIAALES